MARSYSLREGFAKEGKWLNPRAFARGKTTSTGYSREQGSPERVAELERLREQSEINVPVFRGMGGFEVLDSKAAAKAIKEYKKTLTSSEKKKNMYFGSDGDGLFHFAQDLEHANDYVIGEVSEGKGVVEGVLLSKSLLALDGVPPRPDWPVFAYPESPEKSEDWSRLTEEEKIRRYEKYDEEKSNAKIRYAESVAPYKKYGESAVGQPPYFLKRKDPKWPSSSPKIEEIAKAMWVDSVVQKLADAYEKKHGVPMPQDIHLDEKEKQEVSRRASFLADEPFASHNLLKRGDYSDLKHRIFYDDGIMRKESPQSYMVLKTKEFKELFKKAGFDAVSYRDSVFAGDTNGLVSYAVKDPNQFKAYAGDKPVNLKSKNMFDAD